MGAAEDSEAHATFGIGSFAESAGPDGEALSCRAGATKEAEAERLILSIDEPEK